MHPLLVSLALLAFATDGSSIDEGPGYRLAVSPWHIRLLHDRSQLAASCRTAERISACTDLIGRRLECHCQDVNGDWRIAARAHFIPFVYLWDVEKLPHEREHIADLRGAVAAYLQRLTAERFDSYESCRAKAQQSSDGFGAEMTAMQRASNEKLH